MGSSENRLSVKLLENIGTEKGHVMYVIYEMGLLLTPRESDSCPTIGHMGLEMKLLDLVSQDYYLG